MPQPIEQLLHHMGAVLERRNDTITPARYGDATAEYQAAVDGCALFVPPARYMRITGADATDLLHRVTTVDVASLPAGEGVHGTMLSAIGRLITRMWLYRTADGFLCEVDPALEQATLAAIDKFVIMEDVHTRPTDDVCLSLQGPRAREHCRKAGFSVPDHALAYTEQEGVGIIARDRTGLGGCDLVTDIDRAVALVDRLREVGVPAAGWLALNTLRVEAGLPWFGHELTLDTIPVDAGLAETIDYDKGCFPGQEVMAKLRTRGYPARKLWGLRAEGPFAEQSAVSVADREAGVITSAVDSPRAGPIALAVLRWGTVAAGDRVRVGEAEVPAKVCELPFEVDP